MNFLIIKKLNLKKASDRIRILPWTKLGKEEYKILFWNNIFEIIYIIIKHRKSKLIFILSKEFSIYGLIIIALKFIIKSKVILDICDLEFYKEGIDLRIIQRKLFSKFILYFSDVIVVSTSFIYENLKSFYKNKKFFILEDNLDIEFLPKYCSLRLEKADQPKKIGWFGTSGYKLYTFKNNFYFNQSFIELINLIRYFKSCNGSYEFHLFTDNINQIKLFLNKNIERSSNLKFCLVQYNLNKINEFFENVESIIITYGNNDFMKAKSPNRVDTSLWLGKKVITYKEPKNWVKDYSYLNNNYLRSDNKKEIYKSISNNSYLFNSKEKFFKEIIKKETSSEKIRNNILTMLL